jgi:hypothetical protein
MDTVSDATRRLQAAGYSGNWYPTEDGTLRCDESGEECMVELLRVDEVLRFEGQSDPGDEVILFALASPSGQRGLFGAAFGATTSPEESEIISKLRRAHAEGLDRD